MRTKRYKYPIEKIDIQIKDNGKFTDLAEFFDTLSVLQEIANLRKKLLDGRTIKNAEIDDFMQNEGGVVWAKYIEEFRKIAKKFDVGATFVRPTGAAVLSGVVMDRDYSTILKQDLDFIRSLPEEIQLDEKIASTSYRIKESDLKALNEPKDNRSKSTIRRDREWYWLYQSMGYRKLEKCLNKPMQTIRSAIRSYHKRLWKYRVV